jgi:hypothetical protein
MKTKLMYFIASGLLLCTSIMQAQKTDGGIVAGVSTGSVSMSKMNSATVSTANGQNILGFEGGLFARFHFGPFYLKPMALVSYQSGQMDFNYTDGSFKRANFNVGKFEVPVLLGIHFLRIINIEAGPAVNWVFQANSDANSALNIEPIGYSYRVGANVELGRLSLGLVYQGLTNQSSGSSTTTYQTPNELIFEIGFNFVKPQKP